MENDQNQPADFSDFPTKKPDNNIAGKKQDYSFPCPKKLKGQLILLAVLALTLIIVSVYFSGEKPLKEGEYEPPVNYRFAPGETYQPAFP